MKKGRMFELIVLILIILINIISYKYVPENMAINFSLTGKVNYSVNKTIGLSIIPIVALLMFLIGFLPSEKNDNKLATYGIYGIILFLNIVMIKVNMSL